MMLHFLATWWWMFLVIGLAMFAMAFWNQINRMKRVMSFGSGSSGLFKGMGLLVVFMLSGAACEVLMIVGIIAMFVNK